MKLFVTLTLAASLAACLPLLPPVPVATPTPSPTATATATPSITPIPPTPPVYACQLPASDGVCEDKPKSAPLYQEAVWDAQNQVAIAGKLIGQDGIIPDEVAYTAEVARLLLVAGYCSTNGLADEVWVKKTNDFSEHYDIVRSDRVVINLYAARCAKAKF